MVRSKFYFFVLLAVTARRAWGDPFMALLSGSDELATYGYMVPSSYEGMANFNFTDNSSGTTTIVFNFSQVGLDDITGVHIQEGADGVDGSVVVNFTSAINLTNFKASGVAAGTYTSKMSVTTLIRQQPANYYINIVTKIYEQGAIRGQIVDIAPNGTGGVPAVLLTTILQGSGVPDSGGAPNASGSATLTFYRLNSSSVNLHFDIYQTNLTDILSAHVHSGPKGVVGPIVVNLTAVINLVAFASSGSTSGIVALPNLTLVEDVTRHPARFYAQIHTALFPAGALRGQLQEPNSGPTPSPSAPPFISLSPPPSPSTSLPKSAPLAPKASWAPHPAGYWVYLFTVGVAAMAGVAL